jgi:hypothetical protein
MTVANLERTTAVTSNERDRVANRYVIPIEICRHFAALRVALIRRDLFGIGAPRRLTLR